jgi:hypothetical protein
MASWAVSFAWRTTGDGSLAMVLLSDKYAAAATAAERAPFAAGAEVLIALNPKLRDPADANADSDLGKR